MTGWIPFILVSGFIFRGAVAAPREIPFFLLRINDKWVHGAEYFLLFLVSVNAFRKSSRAWLMAAPHSLAFAYCLLMGAATEITQLFIPERVSDIFDWLVDGTGAAIAWGVLSLISIAFKKIRSPRELL